MGRKSKRSKKANGMPNGKKASSSAQTSKKNPRVRLPSFLTTLDNKISKILDSIAAGADKCRSYEPRFMKRAKEKKYGRLMLGTSYGRLILWVLLFYLWYKILNRVDAEIALTGLFMGIFLLIAWGGFKKGSGWGMTLFVFGLLMAFVMFHSEFIETRVPTDRSSSNTKLVHEKVYFIYEDHMGRPVKMTEYQDYDSDGSYAERVVNGQAEPIWDASYKPFGQIYTDNGSVGIAVGTGDNQITWEPPFRFPGQYADPELGGLAIYNQHRFYMPGIGRYNSSDPLNVLADQRAQKRQMNQYLIAQASHPYAYAKNNPSTWIDRNGGQIERTYGPYPVLMPFPIGGAGPGGIGAFGGMAIGAGAIAIGGGLLAGHQACIYWGNCAPIFFPNEDNPQRVSPLPIPIPIPIPRSCAPPNELDRCINDCDDGIRWGWLTTQEWEDCIMQCYLLYMPGPPRDN